ncbi:ankyrin repeat-containing domain protein [Cenococcum geophilum]
MPLHLEEELLQAIRENDTAAVEMLFRASADPNAGLFGDDTAISLAIKSGNEDILDLILQRHPICCMVEEYASKQPRRPTARSKYLQISKDFAVQLAVVLICVYALRSLAVVLPEGVWQTLFMYASHYLWFVYRCWHFNSQSVVRLMDCYRDPWYHFTTFFWISVSFRLYAWICYSILPSVSIPWVRPNYLRDLAFAFPIRAAVDLIATAIPKIATLVGLHRPQNHRWSGPLPQHFDPRRWRSPAEKAFESLYQSDSVTESVVLKLLQADMLASHPYRNSKIASRLFELAVDRCWPELTRYLLFNGVPVEEEILSASETLRWPSVIDAITYTSPSEPLHYLSKQYWHSKEVHPYMESRLYRSTPYSLFLNLAQSSTFQSLATSEDAGDREACKKMMAILLAAGANPLLTDSRQQDSLSLLAGTACSPDILQCMASLWNEVRARLESYSGTTDIRSLALHRALNAIHPNLEFIEIILNIGISSDWENDQGRTPLFKAAYMNGSTDAMKLLLDAGADPDNGGSRGYPPILRTLDDASFEKFAFFLENGANPNATDPHGKTVLESVMDDASSLTVLKYQATELLLDSGAIVFDTVTESAPAFLAAAQQLNSAGWSEAVLDLLLAEIPQENKQDQLNIALNMAINNNKRGPDHFTVFYLLRHGADPASVDSGIDSLLQFVCSIQSWDHEYREEMRELLNFPKLDVNAVFHNGKTPLHQAIEGGSRDFVLLLLQQGADPNAQDADGLTPLQLLCSKKPRNYNISMSSEEVESGGADEQYAGVRGQAAWGHISRTILRTIKCNLSDEEIFQALADHGADINGKDEFGQTTLMLGRENGNSVIAANILYRLGEDKAQEAIVTTCSGVKDEVSAMHLAAKNGDVTTLKVLLNPQNIFHSYSNTWRQKAAQDEELLREQKLTESEASAAVRKMKQQATHYGHTVAAVPSFLRHASIGFYQHDEITFTVGDAKRCMDERICLPNVSVSTWTLEKTSLMPQDAKSKTPLHYAAEAGHVDAVELLLEYTHVEVGLKDDEGKTAADLALENNFYDVYSVLQRGQS